MNVYVLECASVFRNDDGYATSIVHSQGIFSSLERALEAAHTKDPRFSDKREDWNENPWSAYMKLWQHTQPTDNDQFDDPNTELDLFSIVFEITEREIDELY